MTATRVGAGLAEAESWLLADGADAADGLASLYDWLRHEVELRGRVRMAYPAPEPGQMGSLVDVLAIAVGGSGTLTVLANSLVVWLRQPHRSTVRISVAAPDGTKVEITGENLRATEEIESLLRECLRSATAQGEH